MLDWFRVGRMLAEGKFLTAALLALHDSLLHARTSTLRTLLLARFSEDPQGRREALRMLFSSLR